MVFLDRLGEWGYSRIVKNILGAYDSRRLRTTVVDYKKQSLWSIDNTIAVSQLNKGGVFI